MEVRTDTFDDLLCEQSADPAPPPGRAPWMLAVSVGCVLVGVATVVAATLTTPFSEPARPRLEASPEAAEVARHEPAPTQPASAAAVAGQADPEWVSRIAERTAIPARALAAYASAAQRIRIDHPRCGLGWNTLAGIGHVESGHGTIDGSTIRGDGDATPEIIGIPLDGTRSDAIPDTDRGELDGDTVWDRAVGPMQFIPSTWARFASDADGDGVADPHDIDDAAYTAARYLCHTGGDLTDSAGWIAAIASYNSSLDYNHRVAEAATRYAALADPAR